MLEFLEKLESDSSNINLEDKILWKNTPIDTQKIQEDIEKYYTGVSDFNREDSRSRPFGVLKAIKELVDSGKIPNNFTLLDIACGDAIIIDFIKINYTEATIVGLDPNKNKFDYHKIAQENGVILINSYIQNLIEEDLPQKIDVITMFNTCRAWAHSQKREEEHSLPSLCDEWIFRNCNFALLTMNSQQIQNLDNNKLEVSVLNYFVEADRGNDPSNGSFIRIKNKL